ncbi:MAG TPA: hypothetical protein VMM60_10910 [Ilumatobacter sp.]|nr:hypothetical protein [Ilumatobacter sp.]
MMRTQEQLRALPRHWYAVAGSLLLLVLVAAVAPCGGSGDSLADGAPSTAADAPSPSSSGPVTAPPSTTARASAMTTAAAVPATGSTSPSTSPSTSSPTASTVPADTAPPVDADNPSVAARPIPSAPVDVPPVNTLMPPPWAATRTITAGGHVGTHVGCVSSLSSTELDVFFSKRVGPVLGWDYQHVTRLGDDRYLWLFQDTFIDQGGTAGRLDQAQFVHNAALLQEGKCFTLLHGGTAEKPSEFEPGDGKGSVLSKWFWPMGGDTSGNIVTVFWAEMVKDAVDPRPPDGLGWHPNRLFVATYDKTTMRRLSFQLAPDSGVHPIYGYAVESDESYTYLFGNTFEQNLFREGGFWAGNHSATQMFLARVPLHRLDLKPEYRTADGWSPNRADAVPISHRYFVENPMQPRYLDGQWVSATAADGYWGDEYVVEVADDPWGPWYTVDIGRRIPRGVVSQANTYHAHVLPWRDGYGSLVIMISANARDMPRHAYPDPQRYRPIVFYSPFQVTPAPTTTTTTLQPGTTTLPAETTTLPTDTTSSSSTTTVPPTTTTTTSAPPPTTTSTTSTTTTTTLPPTTSTTSTTTSTISSTSSTVVPSSSTTIPSSSTTVA